MHPFVKKISDGQLCLGTCISLSDAQAAEALGPDADLLWIDTEHSSLSLDSIKTMMMGVRTAPIEAPLCRTLLPMPRSLRGSTS